MLTASVDSLWTSRCVSAPASMKLASAGDEAERDAAPRVVLVRIEQCDRLPCSELQSAADYGHRERRRREQWQHVIGAVPRRTVTMDPTVVARQKPVTCRHQVGVGPSTQLDDDEARCRVRYEHHKHSVPLACDEVTALRCQVEQ